MRRADGLITLNDLSIDAFWVGWRTVNRDGSSTKVPYCPRTNQPAEADNSTTWATRVVAEAWSAKNRGEGVGLEFCQVDDALHSGGIDLDTCRDPNTGAIEGWAMEVVTRFGSYCEISPSGTGLKIYFTYLLADRPALDDLFGVKTGKVFKRAGNGLHRDHPPAIEIYRASRFFCVTGKQHGDYNHLRTVSIDDFR